MTYSIDYLKENSCLPGPRANLELLYQFISNASEQEIANCLAFADNAPLNSPSEFVLMCGVAARIKQTALLHGIMDFGLKEFANHDSWRVRESVCIGFQCSKENVSPVEMLNNLSILKHGTLLEKRAYIATLCDPILLTYYIQPSVIIDDLLIITLECFRTNEKLFEELRVLRKALGYCWSVAICADEIKGKQVFEQLLAYKDSKHIQWIVKENLKKNRLKKLDSKWLERVKEIVS